MRRPSPIDPRLPTPPSPMLVVGDLMCDHYVWGEVERISPEAPVQVVRWEREAHKAGGAANTALNMAALGCKVHLIGLVGDDEPGRWLLRTLREAGINTGGVVVSRARATTLKTRIIGRGQHILRIDREVRSDVDSTDEKRILAAIARMHRSLSGIVCSDYSKGVLSPAVLKATLGLPRRPFVVIDPKGRDFSRYRGADVLTPNEKELMEAAKDGDPRVREEDIIRQRAESQMREQGFAALLVTRGASGMDLFETTGRAVRRTHIPATQGHEVFDVTGAGDTVAAVLTLGVAAGLSLANAAGVANVAAGIVVGKIGTAVAEPDTLVRALEDTASLRGVLTSRAARARAR